MATNQTRSTRSSAGTRSTATAAPARTAPVDRAAQARAARAATGASGSARASTARSPRAAAANEGARLSAESGERSSGKLSNSFLSGLTSTFSGLSEGKTLEGSLHRDGDWGQGYAGGQVTLKSTPGGVAAQGQFSGSLFKDGLEINGAGEGTGFAGAQGLARGQVDRSHGLEAQGTLGGRLGAFAEAKANGSARVNDQDLQWDARGQASLGAQARVSGRAKVTPEGVDLRHKASLGLGADAQANLSVTREGETGRVTTETGLRGSLGVHGQSESQLTHNAQETTLKAQAGTSLGGQVSLRRAVTTENANGSSLRTEGVVAVGPGATFEAGGEFSRDKVNHTTTVGLNLVVPTPFGVSLGGGFKVKLADQDWKGAVQSAGQAIAGPAGAWLQQLAQ